MTLLPAVAIFVLGVCVPLTFAAPTPLPDPETQLQPADVSPVRPATVPLTKILFPAPPTKARFCRKCRVQRCQRPRVQAKCKGEWKLRKICRCCRMCAQKNRKRSVGEQLPNWSKKLGKSQRKKLRQQRRKLKQQRRRKKRKMKRQQKKLGKKGKGRGKGKGKGKSKLTKEERRLRRKNRREKRKQKRKMRKNKRKLKRKMKKNKKQKAKGGKKKKKKRRVLGKRDVKYLRDRLQERIPKNISAVCKRANITCPNDQLCMLNIQNIPVCRCIPSASCGRATEDTLVCASDQKTYLSRCHLTAAACVQAAGAEDGSPTLSVKHDGACNELEGFQLLRQQSKLRIRKLHGKRLSRRQRRLMKKMRKIEKKSKKMRQRRKHRKQKFENEQKGKEKNTIVRQMRERVLSQHV